MLCQEKKTTAAGGCDLMSRRPIYSIFTVKICLEPTTYRSMRHKVAATSGGTRASGFATVSILHLGGFALLYLVVAAPRTYYI